MVSFYAGLALSTILHQDPNQIAGGSIFVRIGAGGDDLRHDSVLHSDIILTDGTLCQGTMLGIGSNQMRQKDLEDHWSKGTEKLALVNCTMTGRRGGTDGTDNFDLKTYDVEVRTQNHNTVRMFLKNNIGFRLSGVGTWSSGTLQPIHSVISGNPIQFCYADVYVGDQPMKGGSLELGFKSGSDTVWATSYQVVDTKPLGHATIGFNFKTPTDIRNFSQVTVRQKERGFPGFTLNGITVYVKDHLYGGPIHKVLLAQGMNINANISPRTIWTSRPFDFTVSPDPQN